MNTPAIIGLATGVPAQRYGQDEVFERFLAPHIGANRRARAIFKHVGVQHRHVVVDGGYYLEERSTQARNETYFAEALPLGEATIRRCLDSAGLTARDIDDFFVVSCTGLDIPGLDLRLAGRLRMRPDLQRVCVLGMGCYGAFPGLLRARQAALAEPGRTALMLALELCSLHLQLDDSTENVVVSSLFADGASAAIVRDGLHGSYRSNAGPWLIDAATYCDYQTFDHMAFHVTDKGFRMRLSAYVPDLLAAKVEDYVDGLLRRNRLRRDDVRFWGVHPGSVKILDHIQTRLGLNASALDYSREVLREYGNMSSATILFVLDTIQRRGDPQPGDYGVLLAFGPGLTMESMLVKW
jgi:predicted naringenin-chalcone synthase